jgi:hypothetical protein
MLSTFTLLMAAGAGFRLALSLALRRRYNLTLEIPQGLGVILIVVACLPSWASPVSILLPLGFVLGVVLPDLLIRRT